MNSVDIYVLVFARTSFYVERFKSRWLQNAVPSRERFPFPFDSLVEETDYTDVEALIERLLDDRNQPYSIYWNDYEGDILNPMLFFTNDGGMIAGLTVRKQGKRPPEYYLEELTKSVDAVCGVMSWETPPPLNQVEFMEWVKRNSI